MVLSKCIRISYFSSNYPQITCNFYFSANYQFYQLKITQYYEIMQKSTKRLENHRVNSMTCETHLAVKKFIDMITVSLMVQLYTMCCFVFTQTSKVFSCQHFSNTATTSSAILYIFLLKYDHKRMRKSFQAVVEINTHGTDKKRNMNIHKVIEP